jgi:hypothetical protein
VLCHDEVLKQLHSFILGQKSTVGRLLRLAHFSELSFIGFLLGFLFLLSQVGGNPAVVLVRHHFGHLLLIPGQNNRRWLQVENNLPKVLPPKIYLLPIRFRRLTALNH